MDGVGFDLAIRRGWFRQEDDGDAVVVNEETGRLFIVIVRS